MWILGFDWDETNRRKLRLHGLDEGSIEDVFDTGDPYFIQRRSQPGRYVALGFASEGRFVLVVFEYAEETRWIRVVTAYEPTDSSWWKKYAKAKGLDAP